MPPPSPCRPHGVSGPPVVRHPVRPRGGHGVRRSRRSSPTGRRWRRRSAPANTPRTVGRGPAGSRDMPGGPLVRRAWKRFRSVEYGGYRWVTPDTGGRWKVFSVCQKTPCFSGDWAESGGFRLHGILAGPVGAPPGASTGRSVAGTYGEHPGLRRPAGTPVRAAQRRGLPWAGLPVDAPVRRRRGARGALSPAASGRGGGRLRPAPPAPRRRRNPPFRGSAPGRGHGAPGC